jgi:7,8-dihydropterin-6-yl-methyl-4-(beta-D-ribofuranosyl)aminobenzene 5'-phosphate synthase
MNVCVTILVDNQVNRGDRLLAEHGLCLLVESGESKVLLDAGQTDVCLKNAPRLGADFGGLSTVVLSHGHFDHGGGLPSLLRKVEGVEVVAHPGVFASRYARHSGQEDRCIGLRYDAASLAKRGAAVRLESQPREIAGGLLTTGSIPHVTSFEEDDPHFWVKTDGEWQPDHFEDDQALVARTGKGLVVLLGCAHAGVINTLRHAVKVAGDDGIRAVVGGLHLGPASSERTEQTVAALREMGVEQVVACHCTSFAARMRLHAALGERFINAGVGLKLTF